MGRPQRLKIFLGQWIRRLGHLTRVHERPGDTETVMGSDLMVSWLEGYAFLKIAGKC